MIILYNHGGEIPISLIQDAAECVGQIIEIVTNINDIKGQICICHISGDSDWNLVLSSAKHNEIRIRMSTVGLFSSPIPILNQNGVYTLNLVRNPNILQRAEWELLLKSISNPLILNTLTHRTTKSQLKKLFFANQIEIIPALSILCQGYLIVHYHSLEKSNKITGNIKKSFENMGYYNDELINRFKQMEEENMTQTENHQWWLTPFEMWADDHMLNNINSWKELKAKLDDEFFAWTSKKAFRKLIREIIGNKIITDTVASAYLEIICLMDILEGRD